MNYCGPSSHGYGFSSDHGKICNFRHAFPVQENQRFAECLNLTKGNTGFILKDHWGEVGVGREQRGEKLKLSSCFSFTYIHNVVLHILHT